MRPWQWLGPVRPSLQDCNTMAAMPPQLLQCAPGPPCKSVWDQAVKCLQTGSCGGEARHRWLKLWGSSTRSTWRLLAVWGERTEIGRVHQSLKSARGYRKAVPGDRRYNGKNQLPAVSVKEKGSAKCLSSLMPVAELLTYMWPQVPCPSKAQARSSWDLSPSSSLIPTKQMGKLFIVKVFQSCEKMLV